MQIAGLSGSPRKNDSAAITVEALKEGAQTAGHSKGFRWTQRPASIPGL